MKKLPLILFSLFLNFQLFSQEVATNLEEANQFSKLGRDSADTNPTLALGYLQRAVNWHKVNPNSIESSKAFENLGFC